MTSVELTSKIASKIRQVDAELLTASEEAGELIQQSNLGAVTVRVMEIASLMTRRRTLIECWELASGSVWLDGPQREKA